MEPIKFRSLMIDSSFRKMLRDVFEGEGFQIRRGGIAFYADDGTALRKIEYLVSRLKSLGLINSADVRAGREGEDLVCAIKDLKDAAPLHPPRLALKSVDGMELHYLTQLIPPACLQAVPDENFIQLEAIASQPLSWTCPCCDFQNSTTVCEGNPFITHRGITCVMCEEVTPLTTLFEQPKAGDILVAAGLDDFNPWTPPVSPEDIPF